jgi:hypothetical protein
MDVVLALIANSTQAELPIGTTYLVSVEKILENNIHRQETYYVEL